MKHIFILFLAAFLAPSALSQTKILPLGESTTAAAPGYRKKFFDLGKADGLSIDMIGPNSDGTSLSYDGDNAGFTGKTCADLLNWVDSEYVNYSPDIVILWEGTNDCGWNYRNYINDHPIIDELSLLVNEICTKYPDALVFVGSIPPMSNTAYADYFTPTGVANANVTTYNNAMPGMINLKNNEGKKVYFIDARSLLSVSNDIKIDGIHPNQQGYDKIGVLFYNTIHPFITSGLTGTGSEVLIFPNPVINHQLTINSYDSLAKIISLSLFNVTGKLLYSVDVSYSPALSISLPPYLIKGLYFLKINYGMNTVIKRIVLI